MTEQRFDELDTSELQVVDRICEEFEGAHGSDRVPIERHLDNAPERIQHILFGELLAFELEVRGRGGSIPDQAEYMARFPDRREQIHSVFGRVVSEQSESKQLHLATAADSAVEADRETEMPDSIGRFRVEKIIGQGGFGIVYKAYDDRLARAVAIKVPLKRFYSRIENRGNYLAEARTVARLEHPHIVPIYELGSNEEFPLFIVSKYVNGTSLAARFVPKQMGDPIAVAALIATIAEALQYAHQQGLVHRDVKPGNILIDEDGHPHLTDFGLALREEEIGSRAGDSGTPAYMSPEQTQGEGHRVDGRSDVFSLGVVFYELLVGRRPFRGSDKEELLANIANCQPRPPRQYHAQLPKELERICLKALSRRPSGRYLTALDMAADLRDYLATATDVDSPTSRQAEVDSEIPISSDSNSSSATSSDRQTVAVVPRGLRSFDDHDKDFFLTLLPGPRDRQGLPESIRFWKTRIEETDLNKTFSVGLIYGPSGCGKSSLVKAGLLPHLNSAVNAVYVESPGAGTEATLLQHLRHQCPGMPQDLDLKQSVAALRRVSSKPNQKVLIVIDQFEQWLHANHGIDNGELLKTLRQCDGQHVQCILMVRDDFWLSISRLMQQLDIDLVPGHNIALVDLFERGHARKVLAAFGRSFGKLPANSQDWSTPQNNFLNQAVEDLSQDGKIVGVRLSLFAEMLKAKTWEPATLKQAGGTEGVGVNFLNETFNSRTANPSHRFHLEAAQQVLKALLPESGSDIKGRMRPDHELLDVSGYQNQPEQFKSLIKILDADLRLITPTEVADTDDTADAAVAGPTCYYQLTHDYLVHALRHWLTQSQRKTRHGRAELRLEDRTREWQAQPTSRYLPAWWEYGNIRLFTRQAQWTPAQRKLMRRSRNFHGLRWGSGLLAFLVLAFCVQYFVSSLRQEHQTEQVATAIATLASSRGNAVPHAIADLEQYPRNIVIEEIRSRGEDANRDEKLVLSYALAKYESPDVNELVKQIPFAPSREVENLVRALSCSKEEARQSVKIAFEKLGKDDLNLMARMATVALCLDDLAPAQRMCAIDPDPGQRTLFIDQFSKWHGGLIELATVANRGNNPDLQSAMCLAVGSIPRNQLTRGEQDAWQAVATDWYRRSPNCGLHSAAGWMLRKWDIALPTIAATQSPTGDRNWYVNGLGMTMLEIPAGKFINTKSTFGNNNLQQEIVVTKGFLMSDREVSVRQYRQVTEDDRIPVRERPYLFYSEDDELFRKGFWTGEDTKVSPSAEHPVQRLSWIEAVMYCNCLSRLEGLTPCYERTGEIWVNPPPASLIGSFEEWRFLPAADGYRLPTEAEWELACRATTTTAYSFGDETQRLDQYGVANSVSTQACGSKLPNGWGLFDMHGNVSEWCNDWHAGYRGSAEPRLIDPMGPPSSKEWYKTTKGGSWADSNHRPFSSDSSIGIPHIISEFRLGFRVVRNRK